jgi:hypothetical protein
VSHGWNPLDAVAETGEGGEQISAGYQGRQGKLSGHERHARVEGLTWSF